MAEVLCLSSQVVYGPVGNSAAVPVLQEQGHGVLQVPTILLSYHPGHGKPVAQATDHRFFQALLDSVEAQGALASCAAVMTGYFAGVEQIIAAAALIQRLLRQNPRLLVLVDPIIGDDGRLYVAEAIAAAIMTHLLPLATIVTPNAFELSWLTGKPVSDESSAAAAAMLLQKPEVLVTSVPQDDRRIATLLLHQERSHVIRSVRRTGVPHGTGDFLAGAYLANRLALEAPAAFACAMARLEGAIARSAGMKTLHLFQN